RRHGAPRSTQRDRLRPRGLIKLLRLDAACRIRIAREVAAPGRALVAACDQVEAEQPAFDGAIEHHDTAAFLQAHGARQLHVGAEDPGRPAGVVLLPVRRQLLEEGARLALLELLTTGLWQGAIA